VTAVTSLKTRAAFERGQRTLTVVRKGGKVVTVRLAPRTARAIDLAVGEPCAGYEAASHADPRTTMRNDRARVSLDRHATYIVATFLAGANR
jgi:hypothetical protein